MSSTPEQPPARFNYGNPLESPTTPRFNYGHQQDARSRFESPNPETDGLSPKERYRLYGIRPPGSTDKGIVPYYPGVSNPLTYQPAQPREKTTLQVIGDIVKLKLADFEINIKGNRISAPIIQETIQDTVGNVTYWIDRHFIHRDKLPKSGIKDSSDMLAYLRSNNYEIDVATTENISKQVEVAQQTIQHILKSIIGSSSANLDKVVLNRTKQQMESLWAGNLDHIDDQGRANKRSTQKLRRGEIQIRDQIIVNAPQTSARRLVEMLTNETHAAALDFAMNDVKTRTGLLKELINQSLDNMDQYIPKKWFVPNKTAADVALNKTPNTELGKLTGLRNAISEYQLVIGSSWAISPTNLYYRTIGRTDTLTIPLRTLVSESHAKDKSLSGREPYRMTVGISDIYDYLRKKGGIFARHIDSFLNSTENGTINIYDPDVRITEPTAILMVQNPNETIKAIEELGILLRSLDQAFQISESELHTIESDKRDYIRPNVVLMSLPKEIRESMLRWIPDNSPLKPKNPPASPAYPSTPTPPPTQPPPSSITHIVSIEDTQPIRVVSKADDTQPNNTALTEYSIPSSAKQIDWGRKVTTVLYSVGHAIENTIDTVTNPLTTQLGKFLATIDLNESSPMVQHSTIRTQLLIVEQKQRLIINSAKKQGFLEYNPQTGEPIFLRQKDAREYYSQELIALQLERQWLLNNLINHQENVEIYAYRNKKKVVPTNPKYKNALDTIEDKIVNVKKIIQNYYQ